VLGHRQLHLLRQTQQPDRIVDGGPILAGSAADFLLREPHLSRQPVISEGRFDGIQVFALNIFDERQLQHLPVGDLLYHDGHLGKPRNLGRPPAPFTGNNLVLLPHSPHDQGLNDSVRPNGCSQLLQLFWLEATSWLYWVRGNCVDRNPGWIRRRGGNGSPVPLRLSRRAWSKKS